MPRTLLAALIAASILLTSGCGALVLLGVGGAAGYLIKKGEDSGGRGGATRHAKSATHAVGPASESGSAR
jgi:hypothetical protein